MMKAPTATVEAPKAGKKQCLNFKQHHPDAQAPVDKILQRLDHVRQRGHGQWSARCPAHDDRGPSLTVKELADGKLLLHCFGGCSVAEVVGAVGLGMEDLFPPSDINPGAGRKPERRPWIPSDVFDIARDTPAGWHLLTFGGGIHYCLGASLARLELTEALAELASRLPALQLAGDPVANAPGSVIAGYTSLPISW